MADYLAQRIIDGAFTYNFVIERRPDLMEGIQTYLKGKEKSNLIEQ